MESTNRAVKAVFVLMGPAELARSIGVPRERAKKWAQRNSIPPAYRQSVSIVTGIPVERFEQC